MPYQIFDRSQLKLKPLSEREHDMTLAEVLNLNDKPPSFDDPNLAQVAEVVWQLRGEAGPRQVPGAKIGLCHCMGAGPNCTVIILKR